MCATTAFGNKITHIAKTTGGVCKRRTRNIQCTLCNAGGAKPIYVTVKLSGRLVVKQLSGRLVVKQLEIGSAKSILPELIHQEHLAHQTINKSDVMLRTYNHEPIPLGLSHWM